MDNNQSELARRIGVHSTNISAILRESTPEMSKAMMIGIIKSFSEIDPGWLLTGEGEMLKNDRDRKKYPDAAGEAGAGEPTMEDVERLRVEVLEQYRPEPPLSVRQDLNLRQACYIALADNPGTSWSLVVAVAGAYLKVIQGNSGLIIPTQGLPTAGGS